MDEFEQELSTYNHRLRSLGSRKNRYLGSFYRGLGGFLATVLVAVAVFGLVTLL